MIRSSSVLYIKFYCCCSLAGKRAAETITSTKFQRRIAGNLGALSTGSRFPGGPPTPTGGVAQAAESRTQVCGGFSQKVWVSHAKASKSITSYPSECAGAHPAPGSPNCRSSWSRQLRSGSSLGLKQCWGVMGMRCARWSCGHTRERARPSPRSVRAS